VCTAAAECCPTLLSEYYSSVSNATQRVVKKKWSACSDMLNRNVAIPWSHACMHACMRLSRERLADQANSHNREVRRWASVLAHTHTPGPTRTSLPRPFSQSHIPHTQNTWPHIHIHTHGHILSKHTQTPTPAYAHTRMHKHMATTRDTAPTQTRTHCQQDRLCTHPFTYIAHEHSIQALHVL
jgi:hypothetical protein